jgi:hypothetical protein
MCDNNYMENKIDDLITQIMYYGSIIIVPYAKKIDYIVKDNHNCILFNKETYLRTIDKILTNYDKYKIIKQHSHNYVKNNLSFDNWIRSVIDIIN